MTKINLESLKGMYDRYPEEWASWKRLIEVVEETGREFGFREIDPPSVERQELWTSKDSDDILEEMYSFEDRGGSKVTLVPEQTPTRARLIQKRKDLKTPVKWYNTSKRWRYEDVTKGRDREFLQGDFDIFGIDSVEADAEIIATAARIFQKLDLEERVEFRISDRRLLENILESQGVGEIKEVVKVIDDREKMEEQEFVEEVVEILMEGTELSEPTARKKAQLVWSLTDISTPMPEAAEMIKQRDVEADQIANNIERLYNQLEAYGVAEMCKLDLSIYRGLAYYTGLVFEAFDSEGELRALFGGGRYDELVGEYGDREVPAVGFAFGYSPTVELLKKEDRWPLKGVETDVYILSVSGSVRGRALEYAEQLRSKGMVVETDLADRGFGDQLSYADEINAEKVLIVGERDLEEGKVTVKDMETGEEEKIGEEEVVVNLAE